MYYISYAISWTTAVYEEIFIEKKKPFSFWSYPSFQHDAGGRVIKTIV